MAKRRQSTTTATRKVSKPKAKAKSSRNAKGKTAKKVARSRGRVAESSDDIEVFIPRSVAVSVTVTVPADDDDVSVFIPKAGRPVEVQSDFVDDAASAPLGLSDDEVLESLGAPRALTAIGWTPAELQEHGLTIGRGGAVACRYGCEGSTSKVPGVSWHRYNCVYWQREGATKQPF